MIILHLLLLTAGFVSGVFMCDLMDNGAEKGGKCDCSEFLKRLISGLYLGCAYLCIPRYFSFNFGAEVLAIFFAMFFLATFAIQDMLEHAVYSWILTLGIVGVLVIRMFTISFDYGFYEACWFLLTSGAMFVALRAIKKAFPNFMGEGDYDILYVIFLLAGTEGFVQILFASSVVGLIIYLPALISKRLDIKGYIPYAPILYLGSVIYYLI